MVIESLDTAGTKGLWCNMEIIFKLTKALLLVISDATIFPFPSTAAWNFLQDLFFVGFFLLPLCIPTPVLSIKISKDVSSESCLMISILPRFLERLHRVV